MKVLDRQYTERVWTCPACGYQSNVRADIKTHACDPKRVADYAQKQYRDRPIHKVAR